MQTSQIEKGNRKNSVRMETTSLSEKAINFIFCLLVIIQKCNLYYPQKCK